MKNRIFSIAPDQRSVFVPVRDIKEKRCFTPLVTARFLPGAKLLQFPARFPDRIVPDRQQITIGQFCYRRLGMLMVKRKAGLCRFPDES